MFTAFNRSGHQALSQAITAELAALGQRYGLTFSTVGGAIGTDELIVKVSAKTNDTSLVNDAARRQLDVYGPYYGLSGADLHAIFTGPSGGKFKLTEVRPSAPKYPIIGECLRTGKVYKFTRVTANHIVAARNSGSLQKAA